MKSWSRICLVVAGLAFVSPATSFSVHAQAPDTGSGTPTDTCIDYNGHAVRCSARSSGPSGGNTNSGPSAAEIEAERARAAERERLADEQRKLAQNRSGRQRGKGRRKRSGNRA